MCVGVCAVFATLWIMACQALFPRNFQGKNTEVGCHFLLQGIFLTQGWNLHLLRPSIAGGFFTAEPSEKQRRDVGGGYNMSTRIPLHVSSLQNEDYHSACQPGEVILRNKWENIQKGKKKEKSLSQASTSCVNYCWSLAPSSFFVSL